MKYYIKDPTLVGSPTKMFESTGHAVAYLKTVVQRKTGMNYEQYLTHLADLGHFGYDEREVYESMRDQVDMGVMRGNKCIRCSIFEATINNEGSD
jgi:hypothetical protein|tara:strand:- start:457 stop:741 length:285 start_codon:yes stop_codon:yes gene_type:complete